MTSSILPDSRLSILPAAVSLLLEQIVQQTYPASALYVVATPIGNVGDISLRALHVLGKVDAIACEDTRNTVHLLTRYGLSKPLLAAHQHNERQIAEQIIVRLQKGERIALVSDAGTPAISDPGARIVDAVRNAGLRVIPLPGACAAITAISASGLLNDQFYFVGFLPNKTQQRNTLLASLRSIAATLVFYEAPQRIAACIESLVGIFEGERQIVIAREVSKLFEEIHRCSLSKAASWLDHHAHSEKGEFVVLLEGAPNFTDTHADEVEAKRVLNILLAACSVKQAASLAAEITGQKKNALYAMALKMKTQNTD